MLDKSNVHLIQDEFGEEYYNNYEVNPKFVDRDSFWDKFDVLSYDKTVTEWLEIVLIIIGTLFGLLLVIMLLMTTRTCHVFCVTSWKNPSKNWQIMKDLICCRNPVYRLVAKALAEEGIRLSYRRYLLLLRKFAIKYRDIAPADLERFLSEKCADLRPPDEELAIVEQFEEDEKRLMEKRRLKQKLETINVIAVKELRQESDKHQESKAMTPNFKEVAKKLIIVGDKSALESNEPLSQQAEYEVAGREEVTDLLSDVEPPPDYVESFYGKYTPRRSIGSPPLHHLPFPKHSPNYSQFSRPPEESDSSRSVPCCDGNSYQQVLFSPAHNVWQQRQGSARVCHVPVWSQKD